MAALRQARAAKNKKEIERLEGIVYSGPELHFGLQLYADAFFDLDTERLYETGPIPWSKIRSYCRDSKLSPAQTDTMHFVIRRIDNAVMQDRDKRAERANRDASRHRQDGGHD